MADVDRSSLVSRSQQRAVQQVGQAATTVPFYMRLLAVRGIRPAQITDIETFRAAVPIFVKRDVFAAHPLADLLVDRSLDTVETLISSSGVTALSFSLGTINRKGTQSMIRSTNQAVSQLRGPMTQGAREAAGKERVRLQ